MRIRVNFVDKLVKKFFKFFSFKKIKVKNRNYLNTPGIF